MKLRAHFAFLCILRLHFLYFYGISGYVIGNEGENNLKRRRREGRSPAASRPVDAWFGSPRSFHGDMAVTLRYQGTSVRFGANLGGTAEVSLSSQSGTEGFFAVWTRQSIIPIPYKGVFRL